MFIYLGIALLTGFLISNQSPVNADLKKIVGSPFWAASISFFIGSIFLALVSLFSSGKLLPDWAFISSHPWWIWLGGLLGAIYLTSNVLLFPRLGAIQTVILPILGQIIMGTVIDTFGWFGITPITLTATRIIGVLIVVLGVVVAVVLPNLKNTKTGEKSPENLILWRLWAVIVGLFSAMQQSINGKLGVFLGSPTQGAFISFLTGLVIIFIVALVVDKKLPSLAEVKSMKLWNGIGGILGGLFVLGAVLTVPEIGAGLTIMLGVVGQIVGSMLVQQFGWWRSLKYPIQLWQVIGVIIMIFGIILSKFL